MAKVLVVDDEEGIRFTFHRFLTDAGHEVALAAHEDDARRILSENDFDVAIIDRILSDKHSGIDLMKEVQQSQQSCKIIMISGFPAFTDSPKVKEGMPYAYLTKPIRGRDIVQSVEDAAKKNPSNATRL